MSVLTKAGYMTNKKQNRFRCEDTEDYLTLIWEFKKAFEEYNDHESAYKYETMYRKELKKYAEKREILTKSYGNIA